MKDFWYGVDGIKDLRALLSLASLLTAFWYFGKKNKGNHDICCAVGQKRRAIEEVEMEREKRKEMEADGIKRGTLIKLPEWARSREGGDVTFLLLFFFYLVTFSHLAFLSLSRFRQSTAFLLFFPPPRHSIPIFRAIQTKTARAAGPSSSLLFHPAWKLVRRITPVCCQHDPFSIIHKTVERERERKDVSLLPSIHP